MVGVAFGMILNVESDINHPDPQHRLEWLLWSQEKPPGNNLSAFGSAI
jgi:hypothetical protein